MPRISPERWRVLSPYLDQALEISADGRADWLAALSARDSGLATDLGAILAQHQTVHDEGENTQRHDDERERQDFCDRPNRRVDHAEDQRHAEERQKVTVERHTPYQLGRHPQCARIDEQSDEKSHEAPRSVRIYCRPVLRRSP